MALELYTAEEIKLMRELSRIRTKATAKLVTKKASKVPQEVIDALGVDWGCKEKPVRDIVDGMTLKLFGEKASKSLSANREAIRKSSYVVAVLLSNKSGRDYPIGEPILTCGGARAYKMDGNVGTNNLPQDSEMKVADSAEFKRFWDTYAKERGL